MKTTETKVEEEREKKGGQEGGGGGWVDGCRAMVVQQQSRAWKLAMWTPPLVHSTHTPLEKWGQLFYNNNLNFRRQLSSRVAVDVFLSLLLQPNNHRSPHHFFFGCRCSWIFVVMITSLIIIQNLLYMPGRTAKTTFVKTLILFYSILFNYRIFMMLFLLSFSKTLSFSGWQKRERPLKKQPGTKKIKKKRKKKKKKQQTNLLYICPPFLSLSLPLSNWF